MTTTLSGLRVYVNSVSTNLPSEIGVEAQDTKVERVFYSRRGNGPIYRWLHEKSPAHWRALRVNPMDFNSRTLSMASWKTVPETLQAKIGEHYLD
jgi:hypothetical protein